MTFSFDELTHTCVQCGAFMYVQIKENDNKSRGEHTGLPAGP